jgi:hypothetical protein
MPRVGEARRVDLARSMTFVASQRDRLRRDEISWFCACAAADHVAFGVENDESVVTSWPHPMMKAQQRSSLGGTRNCCYPLMAQPACR